MSDPHNEQADTWPKHGDVLIGAEPSRGAGYTVSVVPAPPQIRHQTYEGALKAARAFARSKNAALWSTQNGTTFTALNVNEPELSRSRGDVQEGD